MEWDLTADFTPVDSNLGFERITWVPDDFLVLNSFMDANTGTTDNPSHYPQHEGGLIFLAPRPTDSFKHTVYTQMMEATNASPAYQTEDSCSHQHLSCDP